MLIFDYLDEQAVHHKNKIAFEDARRALRYVELRKESLSLASIFCELDIYKQPILIVADSCVECAIMAYGVACSGNFYTIVNPDIAREGLDETIKLFCPAVILTFERFNQYVNLYNESGITVVLYEKSIYSRETDESLAKSIQIMPNDPLFVIYTSGSTGVPKGVVISHKAVDGFIDAYSDYFDFDEQIRLAETNANMFVIFSLHLFAVVACGGMEYIFSTKDMMLSGYLMKISEKKLNAMFCISTVLTLTAKHNILDKTNISCMKRIMYVGQSLPYQYLKQWMDILPDTVFIQAYGSTESLLPMIHVISENNDSDFIIPIGSRWKNAEIIVLDQEMKPVKTGGCGELYIRSNRNASGYYKDLKKTQECFIQNPLHNDYIDLVYKTGDIVHFDNLGRLYFDGRNDSMVKRRGYRIELGEIEKRAQSINKVKECVCLYEKRVDNVSLFYEGDVSEEEIMRSLSRSIKAYMIPDHIIKVDSIPHNANSKIDRVLLMKILKDKQ